MPHFKRRQARYPRGIAVAYRRRRSGRAFGAFGADLIFCWFPEEPDDLFIHRERKSTPTRQPLDFLSRAPINGRHRQTLMVAWGGDQFLNEICPVARNDLRHLMVCVNSVPLPDR